MELSISLCMIIKDEEKVLERCLNSVKSVVNEIIIVDTGSTDGSKNIAKKFTDKIFDFEWTKSFADARNFAQSKATGDWILVLDADEYVDENNLREALNEINENTEANALTVRIYNFGGSHAETIFQHQSVRLYKNTPEIKYQRTIHEQLDNSSGNLIHGFSDLVIFHTGYLDKTVLEKNKSKRNRTLIEKEVTQSGQTAFDHFNLGNELCSIKEYDKGLDQYLKAYSKKASPFLPWVATNVISIINCLIILERYKDALHVISDAENVYTSSPDLQYMKAYVYYLQNRKQNSIQVLENLVQNKENYQDIIMSPDFLYYKPHHLLAQIYNQTENFQGAFNHHTQSLKANIKSTYDLLGLLSILSKSKSPEEIYEFLIREQLIDKMKSDVVRIISNLPNLLLLELIVGEDPELEKRVDVRLKRLFLEKKYEEAFNELKDISLYNIIQMANKGVFTGIDALLIGTKLKQKSFLIKLTDVLLGTKGFILPLIQEKEKTETELDQGTFLNVLEKCVVYREVELFEEFIESVTPINENLSIEIGDFLYKNHFKELAINFYQNAAPENYNPQTYVNIIHEFIEKGEPTDALNFVISAINNEILDYRILILGINLAQQLLNKNIEDDFKKLLNHYYPKYEKINSEERNLKLLV